MITGDLFREAERERERGRESSNELLLQHAVQSLLSSNIGIFFPLSLIVETFVENCVSQISIPSFLERDELSFFFKLVIIITIIM